MFRELNQLKKMSSVCFAALFIVHLYLESFFNDISPSKIGFDEDAKKNRKNFEEVAKKRIKVGLVLNEFGEKNQIKVTEQELQAEVQKQIRMMPGQEKMVMDFYQKNPSALSSLRGTVYEEKILKLIKEKAKPNKKEISKDEAEKILKQSQKQQLDQELKDQRKTEKKLPSQKKNTAGEQAGGQASRRAGKASRANRARPPDFRLLPKIVPSPAASHK